MVNKNIEDEGKSLGSNGFCQCSKGVKIFLLAFSDVRVGIGANADEILKKSDVADARGLLAGAKLPSCLLPLLGTN